MKFENDVQILGDKLKNLRMREGLTVREMADALHISVRDITRLEQGKLPPKLSVAMLFTIETRFGVMPTAMFMPHYFTK